MSSYQKELEKYRDIDEDEILRSLSPEELEQLDCELQEMDPEVGAPAQGSEYPCICGKEWLLGVCAQSLRQGSGVRASLHLWEGVHAGYLRTRLPTGPEIPRAREKISGECLICSPKLILKNMLLPAGLRQRDQTKKSPTGPLDRDALLQYLEQQALEVKERDDLVPFTGEKKGMGTLPSMPRETKWLSLASPCQLPSLLPAAICQGLRPRTAAC